MWLGVCGEDKDSLVRLDFCSLEAALFKDQNLSTTMIFMSTTWVSYILTNRGEEMGR